MLQKFANNAGTTLAAGILDTDLSLDVVDASLLPTITGSEWFYLTLTQAAAETSWEILKVTAVSGNTLTVERAQQGTAAAAWALGSKADNRFTAGDVDTLFTTLSSPDEQTKLVFGDSSVVWDVQGTRFMETDGVSYTQFYLRGSANIRSDGSILMYSGTGTSMFFTSGSGGDLVFVAGNAGGGSPPNGVLSMAGTAVRFSGSYMELVPPFTISPSPPVELRFYSTFAGTTYLGLVAPSTAPASTVVWTLPSTDGGPDQVLSTDGAGLLGWATLPGGPDLSPYLTISDAALTYQPLSDALSSIAALATTGIMVVTGSGTVATRTITGTANQVSVSNGDGVSGDPVLSLPQNIHTGASPTFAAVTATTFTGALSGNATTATTATNATNSAITDDTSTNATMYPVWVTAAAGNLPLKVSSTDLTWNPSTNTLALTGGPFTNTQAVDATSTDGLVLATSATATSGNQKFSPAIKFSASYFSGSAKTTNWRISNEPTASGGLLKFQHSDNGGAYSILMTLTPGGTLDVSSGVVQAFIITTVGSGKIRLTTGSSFEVNTTYGAVCANGLGFCFNATNATGAPDLFMLRAGAANLQLGAVAANPPIAQTLSVQDASGTDIAGATWIFRESRATGTGKGGGYVWQLGGTLGTGTTLQTASTALDLGATTYKTLTFADAINMAFNTTTGTKIGTATTQKLSFWNATPIVQPSGANQAAVATTGATNVTPYGFTTAAQADGIVTLLNAVRQCLVDTGLWKGAA